MKRILVLTFLEDGRSEAYTSITGLIELNPNLGLNRETIFTYLQRKKTDFFTEKVRIQRMKLNTYKRLTKNKT